MIAESLGEYLDSYGQVLAGVVIGSSLPLHRYTDEVPDIELLREPYEAQWHRLLSVVKAWKDGRNGDFLSADLGTGKTICAIVACHVHANGKPYRSLVVCPPHLVAKWKREVLATIPNVRVEIISGYDATVALRNRGPAIGPEFYIVSHTKVKLGSKWKPAYVKTRTGLCVCPTCNATATKRVGGKDGVTIPAQHPDLEKKQKRCENCDGALYQWTSGLDRWPVSDFIKKKMRGWFKYLVVDEAHETRSANSSVGNSIGQLCAAIKYKVALTGTMLNGYAESIFPLLYRFDAPSMRKLGLEWGDESKFAKEYGRLETTIKYDGEKDASNKESRGKVVRKTVKSRPGIMPSLYGDCLLDKTVFCSLSDIGCPLPKLTETLHAVEMEPDMRKVYDEMETAIRDSIREAMKAGGKNMLGSILSLMLGWPDHPFGYDPIGYKDGEDGDWIEICAPPHFSKDCEYAKEKALVELVESIANRNRQSWVYSQMTTRRDVQDRLQKMLLAKGLDCRVLRSSTVATTDRELWIRKNAKADVILSHPALVKTGLDLFALDGAYNFASLVFYQTGYQLDTLRQAAGRSWRIGQGLDCEVHYLFYSASMQERCARLMAEKTKAAQAVDGNFSDTGLASLTGGGDSIAMAMAKTLAARIR
jgi:SNF2-related domain